MNKLQVILSLLCFTCCNHSFVQTGKETPGSFIRQQVDSIYNKEGLPGIFVGILNNGEKQFFNAGFADPGKQMPFDSATLFEIGSITKTFTAYVLTAVLMDNKISDMDPIIKYLPDSVQQNKNLSSISFLSLMNHTSGLPRLPDNMKMVNSRQPYENYTEADLFTYLKNCDPKPDGKSNYSNLGGGIAGMLAERITGKTYAQILDKYIFLPFNMVPPGKAIALTENKSQGYFAKDDKAEYWNMNVLAPAGVLKLSANEMLTYLQHMCFPGSGNSKAIVDKLTIQTVALSPAIGVGRGWHTFTAKDRDSIYWHNGGTYGFSTFCAFTKDKSKAVIVVINQFNKNAISDGLGVKIIKKLISEK
ncbi:MAG: serine hydrolase domain-containing protein [Ferruginibacter sp.]